MKMLLGGLGDVGGGGAQLLGLVHKAGLGLCHLVGARK